MNAFSSRPPETGVTCDAHRRGTLHADLNRRLRRRFAATSAKRCCARRAKPTSCRTSAPSSRPRCPSWRWRARPRIMLGLQQLPGADRRRARDAGRPGRAHPLRHRPHRLAPAQRHDTAAPRARARARRVDGRRGGDRLHHRPPGQRGHARHAAERGRHGDRRLRRPRLDPRRGAALAGEDAPLPAQPHGQARARARARGG